MESRHSRALLLCCCLIPLLNFPRALLSDRTLFLRDINTVWSPQMESVVRQVAAGEAPFFDGRRSFGQPLFADPRAEVLYPPSWIHWVLPPERSYALFCAFHLVVAALGAGRLARRLNPGATLPAQVTAALAFGASGPLLSLVSHWHHLAAVAWMPWILERSDPEPGQRAPRLGLAILVTLQILAGSPDYSFLTLTLCVLLLVLRGDLAMRTRAVTLGTIVLGIALASVQLLPSLAFAMQAARESFPVGWAVSPLHPALTIETVLPVRVETWPLAGGAAETLFGGMQVWMFSHYLGLSVWALALAGWRGTKVRPRRFVLGMMALGLVASWGARNEMAQQIIAGVPLVSGLRFPSKHLAGTSLGLALLAANGADALLGPGGSRARRHAGLFIGVALIFLTGLWWWGTGGTHAVPIGALMRALAPLGLLIVGGAAARKTAWVMPVIVGLDLLGSQASLNPTAGAAIFKERPALASVLPQGSRLYVSDYSITIPGAQVRPPAGVPYRLQQTPAGADLAESVALAASWYLAPPIAGRYGYDGSFDLDILDFYRKPLKRVITEFVTSRDPGFVLDRLQRGSVDFVVTMDPESLWQGLTPVAEEHRFFEDPVRVYRVPGTWPRIRFETPDGRIDTEADAPRVLEKGDGRIVALTSTPKAATLVAAVSQDRGWQARIDGAPRTVGENGMAFVSLPVPPGTHRIELVYRPPLLDLGIALSLLSFTALLGWRWSRRSG